MSLWTRLKRTWRTWRHGPRVRCRCGIRRSKRSRCPDCGQLFRDAFTGRNVLKPRPYVECGELPEVW